jgi:hypothetical protein
MIESILVCCGIICVMAFLIMSVRFAIEDIKLGVMTSIIDYLNRILTITCISIVIYLSWFVILAFALLYYFINAFDGKNSN